MKYKLLVLDVDGTLLDSEKKISKRTLAALLKVQQMGVRIVLASGRPTYGLMPIAKALELGNYGGFILSYNGGQIINAQSGELLFERRINPEMSGIFQRTSYFYPAVRFCFRISDALYHARCYRWCALVRYG